ncbi:MAG: hypothetical protein WA432_01275 [Candidatus Babeliaceae bacterium]
MNLLKSVFFTLTFSTLLQGMKIQDPSRSCSLLLNPQAGFSTVILQNQGILPGWVELTNSTNYPVRVVNARNTTYDFMLEPYARKSFNYKGTQEILCYRPSSESSIDRKTDKQVNCNEVVAISKCYEAGEDNRYPDLALM